MYSNSGRKMDLFDGALLATMRMEIRRNFYWMLTMSSDFDFDVARLWWKSL